MTKNYPICPKCKKHEIPHFPLRLLCFWCWRDEEKVPSTTKAPRSEDYPLLCPKCNKNTVITDSRGMIQYCTECDYVDDYPVKEMEE